METIKLGWSDLILACLIGVVFTAVYMGETTPTVYMAEGQCKAVIPAELGSCTDLPSKYEVIFVSPSWSNE
jgi:hypothetical protein